MDRLLKIGFWCVQHCQTSMARLMIFFYLHHHKQVYTLCASKYIVCTHKDQLGVIDHGASLVSLAMLYVPETDFKQSIHTITSV